MSASVKAMVMTPSCVSFSSSMRAISTRAHLGDRRADRVALHAEHVPEDRRHAFVGVVGLAEFGGALGEFRVRLAGHGDARQVALDVGAEHRNAGAGEALGQHLQGDGFAGAGGAGDQAVPVGERQMQVSLDLALADEKIALRHADDSGDVRRDPSRGHGGRVIFSGVGLDGPE